MRLRRWTAVLCVTLLLVSTVASLGPRPTFATAQPACAPEREPNNEPGAATTITGTACIEAEFDEADQDFYAWTLSEADAVRRWSIGVSAVPGQQVQFQLLHGELDASGIVINQTPVIEAGNLGAGLPAAVDDILLPAGDYLIGVSATGVGPYQLTVGEGAPLPPTGESEPNDVVDSAMPVAAAFSLAGNLEATEDWFAWTLGEGDVARLWDLRLQGPAGVSLSLDLQDPSGASLITLSAGGDGRLDLNGLGLGAGTYLLHVTPAASTTIPYLLEAAPGGERAPNTEEEPNDSAATAFAIDPATPARGSLARPGDADYFRLTADAALSANLFDLKLFSQSAAERSLCLFDATETELACRSRAGGIALTDVSLAAGEYLIRVTGDPDPDAPYLIRIDTTSAPVADFETEPNDSIATAAQLGEAGESRGRLTGLEADYYRLSVTGEPQLWRIEVDAADAPALSLIDAAGAANAAVNPAEGATHAELTDIYLLPGTHWLRVDGEEVDYTVRAVPLGPPDPNAEREPNHDRTRAHLLPFDVRRTGRLADAADVDLYRFSLAAEEHVAVRLEPPPDGGVAFSLEWGPTTVVTNRQVMPGEPVVYDAVLPPGDYVLWLSPAPASTEPYGLTLERRDPFTPPEDREPNDARHLAAPFPDDLSLSGAIPNYNDDDWYVIPAQSAASTLTIGTTGEVSVELYAGDALLSLAPDASGATQSAAIPAGEPLHLRVSANGPYEVNVAFDGGTATPLAARAEALDVELSLTAAATAVAAYWPEGQRLDVTLSLTNNGDRAEELVLAATTSHYAWTVVPAASMVTLPPGETATVPVAVNVLPDAWADRPVRVSVRAGNGDGAQATAGLELVAGRNAAPLNPGRAWSVPDELLGGLNVAALGLGAQPVSASDGQAPEAIAALFDGIPSGGYSVDRSLLPLTVDVQLAGDEPVPVAGVILQPDALSSPTAAPRAFEVLLSPDGVSFEPVFRGELSPLAIPQAFAFAAPVPARFARLVVTSNARGDDGWVTLAEWEVIAVPGAAPESLATPNLAAPALGGHVARLEPPVLDPNVAAELLTEAGDPLSVSLEPGGATEWIVGFEADRAARIGGLEWVDLADADPATMFEAVEVAVATEGPLGPWQTVGTWALDRAAAEADGTLRLDLDEPVWARFVRFIATAAGPEATSWTYPATVRVLEAPADAEYRSILGAWGRDNPTAIYELLVPSALPPADSETSPNDAADQAQPLPLGKEVDGRVQIGADVDWYRVEIPAGQNELRLTVRGQPTPDVQVSLQDESGNAVPLAAAGESDDPGEVLYTAAVTPGGRYDVRVEQPQHAVVVAFDTSLSLGNWTSAIYAALTSFLADVEPGKEMVNILPFGADVLLPAPIDDSYALQAALTNYPRSATDSDSPAAIVRSLEQMAGVPGTRAILLITDADTYLDAASDLWGGLDAARPRIFAVHLGANTPVTRGMMFDWSRVNAGYYAYAETQAELDVAFDRAATWLRRPTSYTILAQATSIPTPTPVPTATPTPTATPVPTATLAPTATPVPTVTPIPTPAPTATPTPAPTATPELTGSGSIRVAAPLRLGAGAPVTAAAGVAVELVLDTSGSMLQPLAGSTRADIAKGALIDLVTSTLPPGMPVALRVFGDQPDSCETELAVPLQPLDPAAMTAEIRDLPVVNLVRTPIGASLEQVAVDLAGVAGPKIVVLVTDGEETCGGDPAAAIQALAAQGFDVQVNIVGFALEDEALKTQFEEWARLGNGRYIDAADAGALRGAVAAAVQAPFHVLDPAGTVIAAGVVGGDPVLVPAGIYTVEVLSDPGRRVEGVVVNDGDELTLDLGGLGE